MSPAPFSCSALAKRYLTYQVPITLAGAMLVFIGMRISLGTFPDKFPEMPAPAASSEGPLCGGDWLAGAVVDKFAAKGIDVRSDEWRHQTGQSAMQA